MKNNISLVHGRILSEEEKEGKSLFFGLAVPGIAASLLIGWLGFRFILPGSFSSSADGQQQNISNLEIPVEKDTVKEHKLIRQVPSMPVENKKTKERGPDQALQSTSEPQNKNQTQKEMPDSLNILSTAEDKHFRIQY